MTSECTCPHMDLNEPAYNHDPNCVGRKQPAAYGKVPGCEDCAYNGRYLCDEHGPKPAAEDVALIEALRAEVDSVTAEAFEWRDKLTGEKDRAERLAEALREMVAEAGNIDPRDFGLTRAADKSRALLYEQEK